MIIIIVPRGIVVMPASYLCYNSYINYRAMEFGKSAHENVKIKNNHDAGCSLHCDEEMGDSPWKALVVRCCITCNQGLSFLSPQGARPDVFRICEAMAQDGEVGVFHFIRGCPYFRLFAHEGNPRGA